MWTENNITETVFRKYNIYAFLENREVLYIVITLDDYAPEVVKEIHMNFSDNFVDKDATKYAKYFVRVKVYIFTPRFSHYLELPVWRKMNLVLTGIKLLMFLLVLL